MSKSLYVEELSFFFNLSSSSLCRNCVTFDVSFPLQKQLDDKDINASLMRGDGAALSHAFHLSLEAFFHLDTNKCGVIKKYA